MLTSFDRTRIINYTKNNEIMDSTLLYNCALEFLGTLILVLLGDGVCACMGLNKSKGQGGGWIVITPRVLTSIRLSPSDWLPLACSPGRMYCPTRLPK